MTCLSTCLVTADNLPSNCSRAAAAAAAAHAHTMRCYGRSHIKHVVTTMCRRTNHRTVVKVLSSIRGGGGSILVRLESVGGSPKDLERLKSVLEVVSGRLKCPRRPACFTNGITCQVWLKIPASC